jgi:hypothetical protein
MKPAAVRLLLTGVLFLGWLGYLAFQVWTRPLTAAGQPLVVSHPQVLVSELDVVAQVPSDDSPTEVTVEKVLYDGRGAGVQPGDKLRVSNIGACHPPGRGPDRVTPPPDWSGPGRYLLPLVKRKDGYEVAPIPPSPGYTPEEGAGPPRLYPATAQTEAQYRQIAKPSREE